MAKEDATEEQADTVEERFEIAQISFFLAKENIDFAAILSADEPLPTAAQTFNFDVDGAVCRFHYFVSTAPKSNPPWLDFINEQLDDAERLTFKTITSNPNGLLLVRIEQRVFAATFGRSAAKHLDMRRLEPDFGIRTAMNMCGNEEIRQTRSQSNTITPTQIDRQTARPSEAFVFGMSEAEDLRYISAHLPDNKKVTLQGRDSLTIKIIGDQKLNWSALSDRCSEFLAAYAREDFEDLFPNYRNFSEASADEAAQLDEVLVGVLRAGNFEKVTLSIPQVVNDAEYGFTYSNHPKRENVVYAYLDPSQLRDLRLERITKKALAARRIYAYSHEDDEIVASRRWSLYNCLGFEHQLGDGYYILSDGRWLKVDKGFYDDVTHFVRDHVHEEDCEPAFANIDIADIRAKKNKEAVFNETVCRTRPTAILFDRAKLRVGEGRKDKEFCDILDITDDDVVRIIHCKPYKDASSVNYLFSQARFYCEAFISDAVFLGEIRGFIEQSTSPAKARYLDHISAEIEAVNGADYVVCVWLLYDKKDGRPSRLQMPLMAQYEMKLLHDRLRKVCKFKDVVLRFVPVLMTNFTTKKSPKAA